MDISMSEWVLDVMPICMARPVADTGASMTGGAAQVGRLGDTVASRSCTSCRARSRSVPGLKSTSIEDKLGHRLGPQVVQALDAVQRHLDRHGDQLLDVGGGQADARRLDQHPRRGELGEHVHVHVRQDRDAQCDHADRRGDDQVAEPQAGADDPAHQGPWLGRVWPGVAGLRPALHSSPLMLYSVPSSSGAPTVTTAAPGAGPAASTAVLPWIAPTVIRWRTKVRGPVFTKAQVEPSLS